LRDTNIIELSALQLMPAPATGFISARLQRKERKYASSGLPHQRSQKAATGNRVGELVSSDFP
jgi:hypothetical protein